MESLMRSPHPIPGTTTVRRVFGTTEGSIPAREPLDLDIYIDSSASMPNPQVHLSYLTLAGAIMALSALRTGSRVQATLWSGPGQFQTTGEFTSDPNRILHVITGFFGGSTAFPLHALRETYQERGRAPRKREAHIMVISDDGADTLYGADEQGNSGRAIAAQALAQAGGGGTLLLNLGTIASAPTDAFLAEATVQGWEIARVTKWEDLIAFSHAFSRRKYDHD